MSTSQSHAPLVIAEQGSFYTGGKYFVSGADRYMAGQMYVEYQIPEDRKYRFPIIMWHGGGQSGACYTGTPDGREGWAQYFLRCGYAVYVVDQPGRGRSAYNPEAYAPLSWRNTRAVEERFTATARSKLWPQSRAHEQWPGAGIVGDAVFDQFYAAQLPKMECYATRESLNRDAGIALLDRIGPAALFTHSESGPYGWLIANARPRLVKAIVAAEPGGPPFYDAGDMYNGGSPVYAQAPEHAGPPSRPWGLTAEPLSYEPPVSDPAELAPEPHAPEDRDEFVTCWLQREPARQLINLKGIPIAVVTTEASYHVPYDYCTVRYLRQASVSTTHLKLAEHGLRGNGHMMMLEKNSAEIAALIANWLEKHTA